MEVAPSSEVIRATQESLGQFVKRPPLTEKLLRKPPFRFLHDIITSVQKSSNFFNGLFEEEELISENVKDREAKIQFLTKVISVLNLTTGKSLTVKPSKIISGQEPEKTNELLQCLGFALEQNLSTSNAVEKYKQNGKATENDDKTSRKSKEKLKKTREAPTLTSKSTEKLTNIKYKRDSSQTNKRDLNKKEKKESPTVKKEAQKDRRDPHTSRKDTQKDRRDPSTSRKDPKIKEDGDKIKNQSKILVASKSIDKSDKDLTVKPISSNQIIVKANTSHIIQTQNEVIDYSKGNDESLIDPTNAEESLSNEQNSQNDLESTPLESKVEVRHENNPIDSDTKTFEKSVTESHRDEIEFATATVTEKEVMRNSVDLRGFVQLPKSAHESNDPNINNLLNNAINTGTLKELSKMEETKPEVLNSKPTSSSERKKIGHQNHQPEIPATKPSMPIGAAMSIKSSVLKPPTARPPSARPGAPRPRDKHEDILATAEPISTGKVHVIVENADNDDDDEAGMVIIESAADDDTDKNHGDALAIEHTSTHHGHLVQQILDSQKEFSQTQSGKTEIEWEFGAQRIREASSQDVEQLRFSLQALSRAANPLGKLLDHMQEDVEVMRQELQQWSKTYEEATVELTKQKSATEHALQPLQARSTQLDAEMAEKRDKINDLKSIIHRNTMRISKLLSIGNVQ